MSADQERLPPQEPREDPIGGPVEDVAGASGGKPSEVHGGPLVSGLTRCPFCRSEVLPEREAWAVCRSCLARHHAACWSEGGACASCRHPHALFAEVEAPGGARGRPARASLSWLALLGVSLGLMVMALALALAPADVSTETAAPPRPVAIQDEQAAPPRPVAVSHEQAEAPRPVARPRADDVVPAITTRRLGRTPFRLVGAPTGFDQYSLEVSHEALPGFSDYPMNHTFSARSGGLEWIPGLPAAPARVRHTALRSSPRLTLTRTVNAVLSPDGVEIAWPDPATCGGLEGDLGPSEWVRFVHAHRPDFEASVIVDLSGRFQLDGLPAGEYHLGAVEGNALFEPEADLSIVVTVSAGETLAARPPLTSKGAVYRYRPSPAGSR